MPNLDALHATAHLFSSRTRLAILIALSKGPRPVGALADDLGISRQQLQRPLAELRDAGLVETTADPPSFRPLIAHLNPETTRAALDEIVRALNL